MKRFRMQGRTLALGGMVLALLVVFAFVAVRSGPLAPTAVTLETVEDRAISPAVFGLGTVEPRFSYRIGPTAAGRVNRLLVDVGDRVTAGQLLGDMDPVDLDERIRSQDAILGRSRAALEEAQTREQHATSEARRYEQLLAARSTSEEIVAARQETRQRAIATLSGAQAEVARVQADRNAISALRQNLQLIAPVDGLVSARDAEPGTTVVGGQMVIEIIDPNSLWVNARFDQGSAAGLQSGLPATVRLRSHAGVNVAGRVERVEPRADPVTEEILAKISFTATPDPLPPIGELGEVNVMLAAKRPGPVVPNAAVHRLDGVLGVWQIIDRDLRFTPVTLGANDADGYVQVRNGLSTGDRIVVYSASLLDAGTRIKVVGQIPGATP